MSKSRHFGVVFGVFGHIMMWTAAMSMSFIGYAPPASAQMIVDPSAPASQRPLLGSTQKGVPRIDITTPRSGVSLNRFRDLNVSSRGVVLNNSAKTGTSSLGGRTPGNPNLRASGSAKTIVNEVRGRSSTSLDGPIEVHGGRAAVVIANQNGIACDGCSFRNTSKATITTGQPRISGPNVTLDVSRGAVLVERGGISADRELQIVGRHVTIDGPVSAPVSATVSGGSQYFDHNRGTARPAAVRTPRQSLYSVDGTQFGAMNSSRITIWGNENNLGVRAMGNVASKGNLTLSSRGNTQVGNLSAGGSASIASRGDLTFYGSTVATRNIDVRGRNITVHQGRNLISRAGDVRISASGYLNNWGQIRGRNISISTRSWFRNSGYVFASRSLRVRSGSSVSNIRNTASTYKVDYASWIKPYLSAYKRMAKRNDYWGRIARLVLGWSTKLTYDEQVAFAGAAVAATSADIATSRNFSNNGGSITTTRDLSITAGGQLTNTYTRIHRKLDAREGCPSKNCGYRYESLPGELYAGGNLSLRAGNDVRITASDVAANGNVIIESTKGAIRLHPTSYGSTDRSYTRGSNYKRWVTESVADVTPVRIGSVTGNVSLRAKTWIDAHAAKFYAAGDLSLYGPRGVILKSKTVAGTRTTKTYKWWKERRTYRRWWRKYTRWVNRSSTTTSRHRIFETTTTDLAARDITIRGAYINAPGARIFASRDLTLAAISGSVTLRDIEGNSGAPNVSRTVNLNGLSGASLERAANIRRSRNSVDTFFEDNDHLLAASRLNRLTWGSNIFDDAARVGAQRVGKSTVTRYVWVPSRHSWWGTFKEVRQSFYASNGTRHGFRTFADSISKNADLRRKDRTRSGGRLDIVLPTRTFYNGLAWGYRAGVASDRLAQADGGYVSANRNLDISARRDLTVRNGTQVRARGNVDIDVGRNMTVTNGASVVASRALDADVGRDVRVDRSRLYAGRSLSLDAGGKVEIVGAASGTRVSRASVRAKDDLAIVAGTSLRNTASDIVAGDALTIVTGTWLRNDAVRGSFVLGKAHGCYGKACGRKGFFYSGGTIEAGKGLVIRAGSTITNSASDIISGDSAYIQSVRGDIRNLALSGKYAHVDYYHKRVKRKWYGKKKVYITRKFAETPVIRSGTIEAENGDLFLRAGRDLEIDGSAIAAQGTLDVLVGRDIDMKARTVELKFIDYYKKSSSWLGIGLSKGLDSADWNRFDNRFASLSGNSIWVNAGGDLIAEGASLTAKRDLTVAIDGDIVITPVRNNSYSNIRHKKSGWFSSKDYKRILHRTIVARSQAGAGRDLTITSLNRNVILQAANIRAGGDVTLEAARGKVALLTTKQVEQLEEERYKSNAVWWKSVQSGHYKETVLHNHITAGGTINIRGANGVIVEYSDHGDVAGSIAKLSAAPELAWMAELRVRNAVEWNAVEAQFQSWNHEAEGLTSGAAAVIALAVAVATQGVGSGLVFGATQVAAQNVIVVAALDAGFTSLVSQASISLINNKGNIGRTLKDLSSSSTLRSLATAMVTAGVTQALDVTVLSGLGTDGLGPIASLQNDLLSEAVQATASAGISAAIEGTDFGDALQASLVNAAVSTLGARVANGIGKAAMDGNINYATKLAAHAVLGCAIGSATGGSKGCAGGAAGGVVGEIVGGIYRSKVEALQADLNHLAGLTTEKQLQSAIAKMNGWRNQGIDMAKLAGAIAAFTVGKGSADAVDAGSLAGGNAAENNALPLLIFAARGALFAWTAYEAYSLMNDIEQLADDIANDRLTDKQIRDAVVALGIGGAVDLTLGKLKVIERLAEVARKAGFKDRANSIRGTATRTGLCSFDGSTQVLTDAGYISIQDMEAGMSVWSRNDRTGSMDWKTVLAHYSNRYDEKVHVTLKDTMTGAVQTIQSNKIHPFFVQVPRMSGLLHLASTDAVMSVPLSSEGHLYQGPITDGYWVDAADLQPGYRLLNADESWSKVIAVKVELEPFDAYNLTVDDYHTYFVAANVGAVPVWVHNDCFDWKPNGNPNQLWSKGKLKSHYEGHGKEVGARSQKEYGEMALDFGSNPPKGSLKIKNDGGQYIFDPASGKIFVGSPSSGKIKTFYRWDGRSNDNVINSLKNAGLL